MHSVYDKLEKRTTRQLDQNECVYFSCALLVVHLVQMLSIPHGVLDVPPIYRVGDTVATHLDGNIIGCACIQDVSSLHDGYKLSLGD